jgi:hypothetical protein
MAAKESSPRPSSRDSYAHGLSCLAAAGGRLLQPGDAQAGLLKAIGIRRAIGSPRVGRTFGPGSIVAARPSA